LSAWRRYTGDTRYNFRKKMSDEYAIVAEHGLHRLDNGVTADTMAVPPDVAAAAETVVSAIEANLSNEQIQGEYAAELSILEQFSEQGIRVNKTERRRTD